MTDEHDIKKEEALLKDLDRLQLQAVKEGKLELAVECIRLRARVMGFDV